MNTTIFLRQSHTRVLLISGALLASGVCASVVRTESPVVDGPSAKDFDAEVRKRSLLGKKAQLSYAWGSNKYNVVSPEESDVETVKKPRQLAFFENEAYRDLVLHTDYAVAVDKDGDLLQWGSSFSSEAKPRKTLRGKDILKICTTDDKIYALSRSGKVYCLASSLTNQSVDTPERQNLRNWWRIRWFFAQDPGVDLVELKSDVPLSGTEAFDSISAGVNHLLARTTAGRCFSSPVNSKANAFGQLGARVVEIGGTEQELHPIGFEPEKGSVQPTRRTFKNNAKPAGLHASGSIPKSWTEGVSQPVAQKAAAALPDKPLANDSSLPSDSDIRFSTTLHQIPALEGTLISQCVAGDHHSLVRTQEGRILAFGSNNYGQLGVGPSLAFPVIPTPTEVPLFRAYGKETSVSCKHLAAGGAASYFVAKTQELTGKSGIDVLACGLGQYGGIGNGQWAHQSSPTKVKTISGLQEYDNATRQVLPIPIHDLSIGTTHAIAVLDNAYTDGDAKYGRDVFVWGCSVDYQLGNGKRSNSAVPQHLHPLAGAPTLPEDAQEWKIESRMPHNRLQLSPPRQSGRYKIEETIVAGPNATLVYWKILNP